MDLDTITTLFNNVQSPDNAVRNSAEQQLEELAANNPSNAVLTLLTLATTTNTQVPTEVRQAALLYLKKITPLYWSAGFGSYVGPAISQEVKAEVRTGLLGLVYTNDGNQRILNSAIYTIVQIAAVDFPDEWSDLLQFIYINLMNDGATKHQIIGGLILLHDLFDDIISEELFFHNNVGLVTITHCWEKITDSNADPEIRKHAAALYKICLEQLQSTEAMDLQDLKLHLTSVFTSILGLLSEYQPNVHFLEFKTLILQISSTLISEFPADDMLLEFPQQVKKKTIEDLVQFVPYYNDVITLDKDDVHIPSNPFISTEQVVTNLIIEQYDILSTIESPIEESQFLPFINATLKYSLLSDPQTETYREDFNTFVTDELELSPDYTVRQAIQDFIIDTNQDDFLKITEWHVQEFYDSNPNSDWRTQEALEFLMEASFERKTFILLFSSNTVLQILDLLEGIIYNESLNLFVRLRSLLVLPRFFTTFERSINSSQFAIRVYEKLLSKHDWGHPHLTVAVLIVLVRSASFVKFNEIPKERAFSHWQIGIYRLISQIISVAEEDTPPLLAESIIFSLKLQGKSTIPIQQLMQLAAVDPANVQLGLDVQECMEILLEDIDAELYTVFLKHVLDGILNTITASRGVFSPYLGLIIEILTIFVEKSPIAKLDGSFDKIVEIISNLILLTEDDSALQLSGGLYNSLIKIFDKGYFNLETVLQILNKLLDQNLPDHAVLKVGSLVVSILSTFGSELQGSEYFTLILQATTNRLLQTQHVTAIENFLNVLCYMVELDPEQTLVFLKSSGSLQQVLNFWFSNFDILNGDHIEKNCKAIIKIYLFSDQSLWEVKVDGDEQTEFDPSIIVTRSMRKQQSFQQIPVPLKIVKILIDELHSQAEEDREDHDDKEHGHDHSHHEEDEALDDDDEGWEDVEDVEFDKLQKYINEEGPSNTREDSNPELKTLLINFFKEIASKNTLNFKEIYDTLLSDGQRSVLTDSIV